MKRFTWGIPVLAALAAAPAWAKGTWTATQVGTTSWRAVECMKGWRCHVLGDSAMTLPLHAGASTGTADSVAGNHRRAFSSLSFVDSARGYAVSGGRVFQTLDGGSTWVSGSVAPNGQIWSAVHAAGTHVFVVGQLGSCWSGTSGQSGCNHFGAAHKLEEFGVNWWQLQYWPSEAAWTPPTAVHFTDAMTGYVAEGSAIHKTTVGGGTPSGPVAWTRTALGAPIHGLHFVGSSPGYAVGDSGRIYKTTDAGATWIPQVSGTSRRLRAVRFITPEAGYAVGDSGTLLETVNGGATWTPSPEIVTVTLHAVALTADGGGYAVGDQGVVLKLTGGTPASLARAMPGAGAGMRALRRQGVLLRLPDGRMFNLLGQRP